MKAVSKIVNNEKEIGQIEFPCLMQSEDSGAVVLFTSQKQGTVLLGGRKDDFGEHHADWSDVSGYPWKPFEGKITIGNE